MQSYLAIKHTADVHRSKLFPVPANTDALLMTY